jgi:type III secretory pathway component EscS
MIRDFLVDALWLGCWVSVVPLLAAAAFGLLLAILQAVTQVQEQTSMYLLRVVSASVAVFILGGEISDQFLQLMTRFGAIVLAGGAGW